MNIYRINKTAIFAMIGFAVFTTGCSSMNWPITPVEDVVKLRQQRKHTALEEFSRRRDWAEYQAADNAWNRGDMIRCRESLERLLSRNPRHVEAHVLLAKLHSNSGQNAEALTQIKEAIVVEPENKQLISYRDTLLAGHRLGGSPGIACVENADTDAPSSAAELLAAGESALAEGDSVRATELFNKAVSVVPHDPQIPTAAALAALKLNHPQTAVELASAALNRFPRSAKIRRILGVAYYRSGDYESSQVVLQQALSLDNSNALTYFLQGCTLTKLGQSEAAESYLRRAAEIDPRYAMGGSTEKTTLR